MESEAEMVALRSQKRLFCTIIPQKRQQRQWTVKQVTKSNFGGSVEEFRSHISASEFVAVSLQNTGSFSASWHRVSPFDTPDTAYLKARHAADRFQILQFAVCPFTITDSKVIAHPYNFHLFPRDELNIRMPSYIFSCQTSFLTSMARQGFDFNVCIYDGISYLSRAQESAAKVRLANPIIPVNHASSSTAPTVADSVFTKRIKTRLKHWKNVCRGSSSTKKEEVLVRSLRNIIFGSELFASRPSMTIDICSERQVQLVLQVVGGFSDELVPLVIPAKSGGSQAVRVVLTNSKEDKEQLEREICNLEDEQTKKIRGFREVIDLISTSQKPVISHNSLNDFAFIHSKFIAALPPNIDEFVSSLCSVFPHIFDVNHLMKEIAPPKNVANISAAISYLRNRFFAPIDMEVSHQAISKDGKTHGHNVVKLCHLFAKLCSVLKITRSAIQSGSDHGSANIFSTCSSSLGDSADENIRVSTSTDRKVNCDDLVFLWGFRDRISAGMLKSILKESHKIFSEEFDVRLVDKSCAIIAFWQPGLSRAFLDLMNNDRGISGSLRDMVSEGARVAGYETYKRACRLGLWEADLADSLDKALEIPDCSTQNGSNPKPSEISWSNDLIIDFDDL